MRLIPSCAEVQENLTEYMEGSLTFRQRLGLRLHLLLCHTCQDLLKALAALPRLTRQFLDAPVEPPAEAEHAFEAALRRLKAGESGPRP